MASELATLELREQSRTAEQQRYTASIEMWSFLITELMLFGGLLIHRLHDLRHVFSAGIRRRQCSADEHRAGFHQSRSFDLQQFDDGIGRSRSTAWRWTRAPQSNAGCTSPT
jgi:hypothetical protein